MRRDTYYAKYYGKGVGWPLGIKNKQIIKLGGKKTGGQLDKKRGEKP